MYLSVISILLLFASAICASPVHIGRRSNGVSPISINRRGIEQLPPDIKDKVAYRTWKIFYDKGYKYEFIKGCYDYKAVLEAWKVNGDIDGKPVTLLHIYMNANANFEPMLTMIMHLDHDKVLHSWGWDEISNLNRAAFAVIMHNHQDEVTVNRYLRILGLNHANVHVTAGLAGLSLG